MSIKALMDHTDLPWSTDWQDLDGLTRPDRALAAHCVNNFIPLLEALETALAPLDAIQDGRLNDASHIIPGAINKIMNALATAKEVK